MAVINFLNRINVATSQVAGASERHLADVIATAPDRGDRASLMSGGLSSTAPPVGDTRDECEPDRDGAAFGRVSRSRPDLDSPVPHILPQAGVVCPLELLDRREDDVR
jgi:hypothetical protein